jgi:hypothetical protein
VKSELDLHLWLDKTLVQRQNQLKTDFLDLFEQLGNSVTNEELARFFSNSKGKKISKGNQLLGFPYLVLDLIRDFDLDKGCNIRFVSWFGHGLYFCVFLGKQMLQPDQLFVENGFLLGRNDLPWDLVAQVDWIQAGTTTPDFPQNQEVARLWIKEIALVGDPENCLQILRDELKKILLANQAE